MLPVQGRAVWVLSGSFENANALIARFTEFHAEETEGRAGWLAHELAKRGIVLAKAAEFRRVAHCTSESGDGV